MELLLLSKKAKENFSERDLCRAEYARYFHHVMDHPSDETITYLTMTNGIKNNPITKHDVKMELAMLERIKYTIQEKMVYHQPDAVVMELIPVSTFIMDYYKPVTLSVDVMYVKKMPILVSVSKQFYYSTICALESMKIPLLGNEVKRVIQIYALNGFDLKYISVDIQLKSFKDCILFPIVVNVLAKGEHMPEIDYFIC